MAIATLGWADYVVIGVMLGISTSIGIYYRLTGGRQKTAEEYLLADRSMHPVPLAMALAVSFMSAVAMLGMSSEYYVHGTQLIVRHVGQLVATGIALQFYVPVFFKLQAMSTFEYLKLRFGATARLIASSTYFVQLLLYTGVVLYAPCLTVEATTGLSSNLCVYLVGVICIFYSTAGGMKAVLATDVFQGSLMFISVIMVVVFAVINVDGGLGGIWQRALDGGRIEFDNISVDPTMRHTWWNLLAGNICSHLVNYAINQIQIQRLLTVKTYRSAKLAMWLNYPLIVLLAILTSFSGLAIYAYFSTCDPVSAGNISSSDMLMPYFVMRTVSHIPGLAGLFIAGIFSASLSTISAVFTSLSAVTLEDYIKPAYVFMGLEFPKKHTTLVLKILAVIIGLICLAVATLAKYMGSLLQASYGIIGVFGGPLLGIFTLGMFFESAEEKGAITGTLTSLALLIWVAFGQARPSPNKLPVSTAGCNETLNTMAYFTGRQMPVGDSSYFYLYRISYQWYGPIGFLTCIIVGLTVSNLLRLARKIAPVEIDPDLFTPLVARRLRTRRVNAAKTKNSKILTLKSQETNGIQ